jgi:hypothetical protein
MCNNFTFLPTLKHSIYLPNVLLYEVFKKVLQVKLQYYAQLFMLNSAAENFG